MSLLPVPASMSSCVHEITQSSAGCPLYDCYHVCHSLPRPHPLPTVSFISNTISLQGPLAKTWDLWLLAFCSSYMRIFLDPALSQLSQCNSLSELQSYYLSEVQAKAHDQSTLSKESAVYLQSTCISPTHELNDFWFFSIKYKFLTQ